MSLVDPLTTDPSPANIRHAHSSDCGDGCRGDHGELLGPVDGGSASALVPQGDVPSPTCDLTADPVLCPRADLRGLNLHAYDLADANLHHANMMGTAFHRGSMGRAMLHHADLRGARMRRANLRGADLRNGRLGPHPDGATSTSGSRATPACAVVVDGCAKTDPSRADLTGTNLTGANLT